MPLSSMGKKKKRKEWAHSSCDCVAFPSAHTLQQFLSKGNAIKISVIYFNLDKEKSVQYHHFILPRKHLPQINDPLFQMKCLP